ncbi:MAG TPA: hypothetical protein VFO26_07470 [Gaiella sp.]|uniref:hypothetical protein n=1 Tax=Gaiella sp. TaxID=2663207 RepID=UPI002D7FEB9B|nr:hypothetical protein [Gaiella sp.]HET9287377.1 hypothetical protein [Gaiella sp.]
MTYTLTRDAVDPASGQHTTVERRLEAAFRVWAKLNEDQVYTGTSGDHAEVDGKAVAIVRDDRTTPACTQTTETKGRIGLKFVTSRAPLTAVYISWNPGTVGRLPALPCGAAEIEPPETGTRGKGDWARVTGGGLSYESRTTFSGDVYTNLAAGRNATFELALPVSGQPAGAARAVVRLAFVRAADLEPKPSATPVVISQPVINGISRYGASVWLALTQDGQRVRIADATCTGSIAGGPPVTGNDSGYHFPRAAPRLVKRWPELARAKGWVTLAVCTYEHEEYTKACGKTFRGSLRLVVGGKTTVRRFSFDWKEKGRACS